MNIEYFYLGFFWSIYIFSKLLLDLNYLLTIIEMLVVRKADSRSVTINIIERICLMLLLLIVYLSIVDLLALVID